MQIVSVRDKRLKALVQDPTLSSVKGLTKFQTRRIAEMIHAILVMDNPQQLRSVPAWKAHELKPGHPGRWSLWVSGNERLTFDVNQKAQEVSLLDFEDYH